jgi:hypothetical protein
MHRILPVLAVGALLVAIAGSRAQTPGKDPTGMTERLKEMVKDLADKEVQLRLPALREQVRKELRAEEKERRKIELELTRKYELEIAKLRADLARATADLAKANVELVKAQATAGSSPGARGMGRAATLPRSFRVGGLIVGGKGKGRVAVELGKDKVRTYKAGEVFSVDGVNYRVESVGRDGAVLVVEQRIIAN